MRRINTVICIQLKFSVYFLTKIFVIFLATFITVSWIMVDFLGLWSSALTLAAAMVGIGIMIWYELRKQGSKFTETKQELDKLNNFFKSITMNQIHEKIAVLYDYSTQIPNWKTEDIEFKTNRILADVRAIQQVSSLLENPQKEGLYIARGKIIDNMNNKKYDISKIKAAFDVVFSK
jgi:hypothetical protein